MTDRSVSSPLDRRRFLKTAVAGSAAASLALTNPTSATAATPPARNGASHMKLSLAAYSFSRYLPTRGTPEQIAAAKMRLEDFVDYCAELNLDGTELTAYYFPKEVTDDYLISLKERTFRLGLDVSGTAIGNDFCLPEGPKRDEHLKMCRDWIDYSATLGAPVIRIFAGQVPKGDSEAAALERCIAGINESLDYAAKKGVFLALENHGGITATSDQLLKIVEGVKSSPWFGVNFDGGNFRTADPYAELERIAPYTINAQVKASVAPNGKPEEADLKRVINILKKANYRGYIVLEYEEKAEPKETIPGLIQKIRDAIHG